MNISRNRLIRLIKTNKIVDLLIFKFQILKYILHVFVIK